MGSKYNCFLGVAILLFRISMIILFKLRVQLKIVMETLENLDKESFQRNMTIIYSDQGVHYTIPQF